MKLGNVLEKMHGSDMVFVGKEGKGDCVGYKFYAGLVSQCRDELQAYMDREVEGLHPEMFKGLVINIE